jgi:hypothetical protein
MLKEYAFQLLLVRPRYVLPCFTLAGTKLDTGIDPLSLLPLVDYWEECRGVYRPFESGQLTGSADVYDNEVRNHRTRGWDRWAAVTVTRPAPRTHHLSVFLVFPDPRYVCAADPGRSVHEHAVPVQAAGLDWSMVRHQEGLRSRQPCHGRCRQGEQRAIPTSWSTLVVCDAWYLHSSRAFQTQS